MLHDSGQRRRLEPGTEVGGAKPTPSPFLCATITLESPVKLSLQAPKSSGPSTLFLLPFRSHFTLICRIRASHLVTSAFADLGVNLLWSDLQGIFSSVTVITISQLHRPACRHTPSQRDQEQFTSVYTLVRIEEICHGLLLQMRIARHTRLPQSNAR